MEFKFKYLDCYQTVKYWDKQSSVKIVNKDEFSHIILQNSKLTSILCVNAGESLQSVATLDNDGERSHIFEVAGALYKLTASGHLFRLSGTVNNLNRSADCVFGFSGSGSSDSEVFSWSNISDGLGKIECVTGTAIGFAAISNCEETGYLKLYEMKENPVLKTSLRLSSYGVVSADSAVWFITSLRNHNLSPGFIKYVFGELMLVLLDIIIFCDSSGLVSLFPVLSNESNAKAVPLHCDSGKLVSVDITSSGDTLVFFYEKGSVVFASYDGKSIVYKKNFLSTSLRAAIITEHESSFGILWSNGISTFFTNPTTFSEFDFRETETSLNGIMFLEKSRHGILACNANFCFYKVILPDSYNNEIGNYSNLMSDISYTGEEIEAVEKELKKVNDQYNALVNEQMDASQINLSLTKNLLRIENLSETIFKKEIWLIKVESFAQNITFVKHFDLDKDFEPKSIILLPLEYFSSSGCENLEVSFVGNVGANVRLLLLNVGFVKLQLETDVKEELSRNIRRILS